MRFFTARGTQLKVVVFEAVCTVPTLGDKQSPRVVFRPRHPLPLEEGSGRSVGTWNLVFRPRRMSAISDDRVLAVILPGLAGRGGSIRALTI